MTSPHRKFTAADLLQGRTYRVTQAFQDYDGIVHPVGETWRFLGKNFLPYEDGLTLLIERDDREVSIRLQWRDEAQGGIIGDFSSYVEEL